MGKLGSSDAVERTTTRKFTTEHLSGGSKTSTFCPVKSSPILLSTTWGKPTNRHHTNIQTWQSVTKQNQQQQQRRHLHQVWLCKVRLHHINNCDSNNSTSFTHNAVAVTCFVKIGSIASLFPSLPFHLECLESPQLGVCSPPARGLESHPARVCSPPS